MKYPWFFDFLLTKILIKYKYNKMNDDSIGGTSSTCVTRRKRVPVEIYQRPKKNCIERRNTDAKA